MRHFGWLSSSFWRFRFCTWTWGLLGASNGEILLSPCFGFIVRCNRLGLCTSAGSCWCSWRCSVPPWSSSALCFFRETAERSSFSAASSLHAKLMNMLIFPLPSEKHDNHGLSFPAHWQSFNSTKSDNLFESFNVKSTAKAFPLKCSPLRSSFGLNFLAREYAWTYLTLTNRYFFCSLCWSSFFGTGKNHRGMLLLISC